MRIFLMFAFVVLLAFPAQAMESLRNCPAKMERGYALIEQANSCEVDSDCRLATYFCDCLGLPVNKNADLCRVDRIFATCQKDIMCETCGPETDLEITLRCESQKCVRYVDGKKLD